MDRAELAQMRTLELEPLAEMAEHGEVRVGVPLIRRDGLLRQLETTREHRDALAWRRGFDALAQRQRLRRRIRGACWTGPWQQRRAHRERERRDANDRGERQVHSIVRHATYAAMAMPRKPP